jgi:hypothetical protein
LTEPAQRSVITPYVIPVQSKGTINVGDGFILRAIERLFGKFDSERCFSNRVPPTVQQMEIMKHGRSVVIAGANQLHDHFAPWPDLKARELRDLDIVLLPVGVGLHGDLHRNQRMSDETRAILEAMHERISSSSWRCPRTVDYLVAALPHLKGKVMMTGCPVIYDKPILENRKFHDGAGCIAVTATERENFWARETQTIDFVVQRYPHSRRLFVVHQDYKSKPPRAPAKKLLQLFKKSPAATLRDYARRAGFEIVVPKDADEAMGAYAIADMHFGSRLHAHLLMLSLNKRSFLTKVDERVTGIAEAFDFPICDPSRFEDVLGFDFERVRQRALATFGVMERFVRKAE